MFGSTNFRSTSLQVDELSVVPNKYLIEKDFSCSAVAED
jgi:hypothetical protein